jgi:hypothetical protein
MQSTPVIMAFLATEAHHAESVSTMLALLAKIFFLETAFLFGGFGRLSSCTRRAW